eukprot:TRINITY_DN6357_c0_g1_i2.p1 TRINITY_DN6357_c0_g1~~TRINITY_DN6357_c0_g1_i2.p1  ORF type:complete len:548 (-),score=93.87 TRINITY_DN6357_c0_g1_i2:800-2443(-)
MRWGLLRKLSSVVTPAASDTVITVVTPHSGRRDLAAAYDGSSDSYNNGKRRGCACAPHIPLWLSLILLVTFSVIVPVICVVGVNIKTTREQLHKEAQAQVTKVASGLYTILQDRLVVTEDTAWQHVQLLTNGYYGEPFSLAEFQSVMLPPLMVSLVSLQMSSSLYVTLHNGALQGALQTPDGQYATWETFGNGTACQWPVNSSTLAKLGKPDWCDDHYDGNSSVWYQVVANKPSLASSWTPLYSTPHQIYVTFSIMVHLSGTPYGVVAADWILDSLEKTLSGVEVTGCGFIVNVDDETFLGSTDISIPTTQQNKDTGLAEPVPMGEVQSDLVLAANKAVIKKYGSWAEAGSHTVDCDNGIIVSFRQVQRGGLSWAVAVAQHQSKAKVPLATVLIPAAITVAVIFLSVLMSILVIRPLRTLSREMVAISQLQFGRMSVKRLSIFTEVQHMQRSFLRFKAGIKAMTKYAPPEVVMDIMSRESSHVPLSMSPKRIAILFCDIKGFTTMGESLPHNVLVGMLSVWLNEFGKVIAQNHGTIDKFIGDCIMCL